MTHIITTSWKRFVHLFKKQPKLCFLYSLILTLCSSLVFISGGIMQATGIVEKNPQLSIIFQIAVLCVSAALTVVFSIAMIRFLARLHEKNTIQTIAQEVRSAKNCIIPGILVMITYNIIMFGGFLLLIIPGFIFAVWYSFAFFGVILENKGIRESLSYSKKLVQGQSWSLFFVIAFFTIAISVSSALLINLSTLLFSIILPKNLLIMAIVQVIVLGTLFTLIQVGFTTSLYTLFRQKK